MSAAEELRKLARELSEQATKRAKLSKKLNANKAKRLSGMMEAFRNAVLAEAYGEMAEVLNNRADELAKKARR